MVATNLGYHGVAVAVREDLHEKFQEMEVNSSNMICIKNSTEKEDFMIINVYFPTGASAESLDKFWEALDEIVVCLTANENKKVIILPEKIKDHRSKEIALL